jgi:hypothetical protein
MRRLLPYLRVLSLQPTELPMLHSLLTPDEMCAVMSCLMTGDVPDTLCSNAIPRIKIGYQLNNYEIFSDSDQGKQRKVSMGMDLCNSISFYVTTFVHLTAIEFISEEILHEHVITFEDTHGVLEEDKEYSEFICVKISHPEKKVVEFGLTCYARYLYKIAIFSDE